MSLSAAWQAVHRRTDKHRHRQTDWQAGSYSSRLLPAFTFTYWKKIDLDSLIANQSFALKTHTDTHTRSEKASAQWRKSKVSFLKKKIYNKSVNQTVYLKATHTDAACVAPYIETYRRDTVGAFYKTKRAALFPFVIITPSVLFFSFPWTFPPFHRDTDENLMKPGTVGAPPGDLRVEYFNCTFTPSVCLQRRDCSRTASHKLNALSAV